MVHTIHKPQTLDNLAFRVEAGGKSIVIAGDNVVCESPEAAETGRTLDGLPQPLRPRRRRRPQRNQIVKEQRAATVRP